MKMWKIRCSLGNVSKWFLMRRRRRNLTSLLNNPCVSELTEVDTPKGLKDEEAGDKDLHTAYRSLLGSINCLQSLTQFQSCSQFSRCASAAAAPTIGDCKTFSKLCSARDEEGVCLRNSSGEKAINLRDWHVLLSQQLIAWRRQNIRRPEWEKLPRTGHPCYLFTRAWEIGRWKSHHKQSEE